MSFESRASVSEVAARLVKDGVKAMVDRSGLAVRRARRHGGSHIVMIHGVGGEDLPVRAFRVVLEWLDAHFELVSLAEVVGRLEAGGPMDHCVSLTFDDGLRNNRTVAYPVLSELGIPATFFVCPGLIDAGARLWTHEARFRLAHLRARSDGSELAELERWGYRPGSDVVGWMKGLTIDQRREVEGWIAANSADFVPTAAQAAASELLDWEDLRSLDADLVTIGSHSLTHPILASVPLAEAEHEICGSGDRLADELGRSIDFFCYPNGDHQPAHLDMARTRYRAAVGVRPGTNLPGRDLADLFRVPITTTVRDMAWALSRASG